MKAKICIGVPYYGSFSGDWVFQTMHLAANIAQQHSLRGILAEGVMTADHNRNNIADAFLKTDAEWLFWIDSDTVIPVGAVERMLAHGRTLVSGLYYGKNPPHPPIAYHVYNGAFAPIEQTVRWETGEILNVDATGMGCMLTHRSVYEDIRKSYKVFQSAGGGIHLVHNDDIIKDEHDYVDHTSDGNYLHLRVTEPTLKELKFPYFMVEHLRTEDMFFFDKAVRVGHKPVLDTSVECAHLRWSGFTGADYRTIKGH